uniref:Uncharacterized protein n=1 Tax=Arundo donax TaxID=35708 RepID=A0A0A9H6B5_ARUDO
MGGFSSRKNGSITAQGRHSYYCSEDVLC